MGRFLSIAGTAVITAILTSAFWIFTYNIGGWGSGPDQGRVAAAGDKKVVDPAGSSPLVVAESVTVGPAGLAVPVAGVQTRDLTDTFTQARAGGQRSHDAIDIMAPKGRPVVAAAPGTVEKLFFSNGGGGITAYVRSLDGKWMYYYAHLDAYAPGLHEGQKVDRGTPIGTVGVSGNANPAGPHLHFAIIRTNPGEKWYEGEPINPYPLLAGKQASR